MDDGDKTGPTVFKTITDNDGGRDFCDSDFGISDDQLAQLAAARKESGENGGYDVMKCTLSTDSNPVFNKTLTDGLDMGNRDSEYGFGPTISDSDFGLSDRQLADLWETFEESIEQDEDDTNKDASRENADCKAPQVAAPVIAAAEAAPAEVPTAAAAAPEPTSVTQSEPAAVIAPTKQPESPKAKAAAVEDHPLAKKPENAVVPTADRKAARRKSRTKTGKILESLEHFLEREVEQHPTKAKWKLAVISSRVIKGMTWYLIRVEDRDPRLCMKAEHELATLDQNLRWVTKMRAGCVLPAFPARQTGIEKFKNLIGAGDLAKQQRAMQTYLDGLVAKMPSPEDEPLLEDFFSRENMANVFNAV